MRAKLSKIITSRENLINLMSSRFYLSYVNMFSLNFLSKDFSEFHFLVDGWPIRKYLLWRYSLDSELMSFFNITDLLSSSLFSKRFGIIGYSDEECKKIEIALQRRGTPATFCINGYHEVSYYLNYLRNKESDIDILIIGMGQPKQERLLAKIVDLDMPYSAICCGAWVTQFLNISFEPKNTLPLAKYLTVFYRFWNKPQILFQRTLKPLPNLNSFFKDDRKSYN